MPVVSTDLAAGTAIVAFGPVRKEISTALLDSVMPGDFMLVHVGFALHKLSPEEAERTLALIREVSEETGLDATTGGAL